MSSIPTFAEVLYLVVRAFHLDDEEPALRGSGQFQAQLTGRRIDRRDASTQRLFGAFARELLRARVFPAIAILHAERDTEPLVPPHDEFAAGDSAARAQSADQDEARLTEGLLSLAERYEEWVGESRSQVAAAGLEPAYVLIPIVRFLSHHLSVVLGTMLNADVVADCDLERASMSMSWCEQAPTCSPMAALARERGISRSQLKDDHPLANKLDRKTIDNLWIGGPECPDLRTIGVALESLNADSPSSFVAWRRWYGLRAIATEFAVLWGWEHLAEWVGATISGADELREELGTTGLDPLDRRRIAKVAFQAGWELPVARFHFGRLADHGLPPGFENDFIAISTGATSVRLQECIQIASAGPAIVKFHAAQGLELGVAQHVTARDLSVLQSCPAPTGSPLIDALAGLLRANGRKDWRAAERCARVLVDACSADPDSHIALARALQMQNRWDDALTAIHDGLARSKTAGALPIAEAEIEMDRASHARMQDGFVRALQLVRAIPGASTNWHAQLLEADCHVALGMWIDGASACERAFEVKADLGEACALASMCHRKLGNRRKELDWGRRAAARGAGPLLALLRERDVDGLLGSASLAPVPCWHRYSHDDAAGA